MLKILKKEKQADTENQRQHNIPSPYSLTQRPMTVGGSVIGLYFNEGIIIATDTAVNYGDRIQMFKNAQRVSKINNNTIFGSSGEFSDFQEIQDLFEDSEQHTRNYDDNIVYTPKAYANFLARKCYALRNKMNPLWTTSIVGGLDQGNRYLAMVDLYGTLLEGESFVTGFANYLCKPLIWNYWKKTDSEAEVKKLLIECFKVLFYRDCGATDRIQFAVVDKNGSRIEEAFRIDSKWDYKLTKERANEKIYRQ